MYTVREIYRVRAGLSVFCGIKINGQKKQKADSLLLLFVIHADAAGYLSVLARLMNLPQRGILQSHPIPTLSTGSIFKTSAMYVIFIHTRLPPLAGGISRNFVNRIIGFANRPEFHNVEFANVISWFDPLLRPQLALKLKVAGILWHSCELT